MFLAGRSGQNKSDENKRESAMATETTAAHDDLSVQEHCIDLPGETVQCWVGGGTDKLKVILRKHRDVIFDIHLGNGRTYTLETTESDFYNARDKKLVCAGSNGKITFNDGERMHVWVSRNFRGAFLLTSDAHLIAKVEPSQWDKHPYGEQPKEKPAPIIVAIGVDTTSTKFQKTVPTQLGKAPQTGPAAKSPVTTPSAASAPVLEHSLPVVCVIDAAIEGMPSGLIEYFKKGGDHSGLSDIDPNHVATKNWLLGQTAGVLAYAKDNWEWLRASLDGKTSKGFRLVKAQVRYVRGKVRFYFSGYSNSNTVFGRGGFGPGHDRIMAIFGGAGKTSSTFAATTKGIAATFKEAALVSFIFGSATAIAEWKDDVHKDGYDLAAALITTTVKTILVAALVSLVVAGIVALIMMVAGVALCVITVGLITIGVGAVVTYIVESADKSIGQAITHEDSNTDGTAAVIAPWFRSAGHAIEAKWRENWTYLMHRMSSDYQEVVF